MLCDRSTAMDWTFVTAHEFSYVSRSRWGNSSIAEATKNWGSMFQEPGTWCCRKSINHYPFKSVWIQRNFGSGFGTSSHSDCNYTIHSKRKEIFEFQGLPSKRASGDFLLLRAPKVFPCLAVWDSQAKIRGKVRICFNESRAVILLNSRPVQRFHLDSLDQRRTGYWHEQHVCIRTHVVRGCRTMVGIHGSRTSTTFLAGGQLFGSKPATLTVTGSFKDQRVLRHAKTGDCKIGLGMHHTISHQKIMEVSRF